MANLLAPVARQRTLTDLGIVAPGALLSTLVSGSPSTPLATTSDAAGLVANANPIVASAGGLFGPIYLTPGTAYRFRLTDAAGVPIWDQDPVTAEGGGHVTGNLTVDGAIAVAGNIVSESAVTGGQILRVTNTAAGTGNYAQVAVGNNIDASLLTLSALSSTYATVSDLSANSAVIRTTAPNGLTLTTTTAAPIRFWTNFAERMRITPSGQLAVNTVLPVSSGQVCVTIDGSSAIPVALMLQNMAASNAGYFAQFLNNAAGLAGQIQQTGATTVAYQTTSDARLKDDAGPATDLAALRAVVVHDFTWKADGIRDRGIFAQEAHAHFPRAVTAGTDATTAAGTLARPWMTDYSKFVPDLLVGWQQHDAAIADLRAAVARLTGSV